MSPLFSETQPTCCEWQLCCNLQLWTECARAGPVYGEKTKLFFWSIPIGAKVKSAWGIVLFRMPHATEERSSWLGARFVTFLIIINHMTLYKFSSYLLYPYYVKFCIFTVNIAHRMLISHVYAPCTQSAFINSYHFKLTSLHYLHVRFWKTPR